MHLKSIKLYGFKSFADRTEIDFESGVTSIVGPNGCGKSNVVDSIKWVLGEQSAKSLRGEAMVDVIFNGTDNRRPLSFAEVTLIFTDVKDFMPVETAEVAVTRRLYRTGESEYLINKKQCRLKDVRDLFMDTGLGSMAYSVIEQGKVDFLLYATKDERRHIFDESAGISKYKSRKKVALSKLEKVEQNLLRVTDILQEVSKQLRSISYQASKARRYQRLAEEIREMKIVISLADYDEFQQNLEQKKTEIEQLGDQVEKVGSEIDLLQAEIERDETAALELDHELTKIQAQEMNMQAEAERIQKEIDWAAEKLNELDQREKAYQEEIDSLSHRISNAETETRDAREAFAQYSESIIAKKEAGRAKNEELERVQEEWTGRRQELDQRKNEFFERMKEQSGVERKQNQIVMERDMLRQQLENLSSQKNETDVQVALAHRELQNSEEKKNELNDNIARHENQLANERGRHSDCVEISRRLREERATLGHSEERLKSRLDLLTDLDQRMEGISSGASAVIEATRAAQGSDQEASGWQSGVVGMVADLLKVPEKYARAVETLLGQRAQDIVVENMECATNAISFLHTNKLGRATFIPRDRIRASALPEVGGMAEVLGRVVDLVGFEEPYKAVFEHILGNAIIVEDMSAALRIGESLTGEYVVATLGGDIIYPSGVVSGGESKHETGLISRRSEMASLPEKIKDVADNISSLNDRLQHNESERVKMEEAIRVLGETLSSQRLELSREEMRFAQKGRDKAQLLELQDRLKNNSEETAAKLGVAEQEAGSVEAKLAELRDGGETLQTKLQEAETGLQTLTSKKTMLEYEIANLRVEMASLEERCGALERQIAQYHSSIEEYRNAQEKRKEEIRQIAIQRSKVQGESEMAGEKLEESFRERETIGRSVIEIRNRRETVRKQVSESAERLKGMKDRSESVSEARNEARMKETECRIKSEAIAERLMNDFTVDMQEAYPRFQRQKPDLDLVTMREELGSAEEKVQALGSINIEAIDEQVKLQERLDYLTEQEKDIRAARRQLLEIIDRINRVSRELFEKTFNAVKENFGEIFRKLFGGGKAEIYLEEDKDILDAGIEIVARPPGKELKAISLLSGGEKVLTTIALLFSLFRSRPTPFCILDEVDAPLDESNIDRFMAVLKDFLDDSQFIIITHNKRTVSLADAIYGITMQEVGISKVFSVKFAEVEEPQLVMSYELGV